MSTTEDAQLVERVTKMLPGESMVYFEGYAPNARAEGAVAYAESEFADMSWEEVNDRMKLFWKLGPGYEHNNQEWLNGSFVADIGVGLGTLCQKRIGPYHYKYIFVRNHSGYKSNITHANELREVNRFRRR